MRLTMTHERKLQLLLVIIVTVILALSLVVVYQRQWSMLAIATLAFVEGLLLTAIAYRLYEQWQLTLMNLTSYTQLLGEGVTNVIPRLTPTNGLIKALQEEINNLANQKVKQRHTSLQTLSTLMDEWPIAVALFDEQHQLIYRNPAMLEALKLPLLIGTPAKQHGFITEPHNGELSHPVLSNQWQTQQLWYNDNNQRIQLVCATNISQSLRAHESIIQENLIRVFSHELRNSLTPMESMTDTLLSQKAPSKEQTTLVLTRIHQRSKHLLDFINQYADLSRLPTANLQWFDLAPLIDESKSVFTLPVKMIVKGEKRCYGDVSQLSMLFINLFKNASQSVQGSMLEITVVIYHEDENQCIEVSDNGPGFTNLNNASTPFYTTKSDGNGIGLALCREIAHQHNGILSLSNTTETGGAKITLKWPLL
ncbi:MAG: hypothetical protein BM565_11295 [Gammaproteobacteria bacterium MedPE]|nr:MAG: hypothetical protein BM565_11295 [Gammaproteobacteria bacterium MedPE]